jgi:hypothetical protein
MKDIVYIETTIVSYLVARLSRDLLLAAHQQLTQQWWGQERPKYHCITSDEAHLEAARGNAAMSRARIHALNGLIRVPIGKDVEALATDFLASGTLPSTMRSDAIHLAAAAVARADYLLTWNCRHLANAVALRNLARKPASGEGNFRWFARRWN